MEYLTISSVIHVEISGFTKQADADKAKFSLLRKDSQKKILDSSSPKFKKATTLDPLDWTLTIDEEVIKAAIAEDEMQCEVFISITAGGKTWSPEDQQYVIYRNRVTLVAKSDSGANIGGARCICTIRMPPDYTATKVRGGGKTAPGKSSPSTARVRTADDGTAPLPLEGPGNLDLVWEYPYYPKDAAAWVAQSGAKREVVLLQRARKARFHWPELAQGADQKQYVNLLPRPSSNFGRRLEIVVGIDKAVPGDKIYLTVELSSKDSKDPEGNPLKCAVNGGEGGGDLEVGKPKKTVTLSLDSEEGTRTVVLDFGGWGGIIAKLGVSSVEGSTDETINITSWRKVEVQPYIPAEGFFEGNTLPEGLVTTVKKAFDPVFMEMAFLESKLLSSAYPDVETSGMLSIASLSSDTAQAYGLDTGTRSGGSALIFFKMSPLGTATPDQWLAQPGSKANVGKHPTAYLANPQTTLHLVLSHGCYAEQDVVVSLSIAGGKVESAVQQTTTVLLAPGDSNGALLQPWSADACSYWQVVGEETRGEVTADFIEVDRTNAKVGIFGFKCKLPEGAPGDPRKLAADGKTIKVHARLRGYRFGATAGSTHPLSYVAMPADYASAYAAYTLIHELGHALGFAPPDTEFYYNVSGGHCANGLKSDAEAYVKFNRGTIGTTLGKTLANGVPGRNVPLELAALGKFGKCVMWGHSQRQMSTENMFKAALTFCDSCAPLVRLRPIGTRFGGET